MKKELMKILIAASVNLAVVAGEANKKEYNEFENITPNKGPVEFDSGYYIEDTLNSNRELNYQIKNYENK